MTMPDRHMRLNRTMRATALVVVLAAITAMLSACVVNRRDAAEDLDRHVRTMAGVADTDMNYTSDFTNGEGFRLTVALKPDVTERQIRDIGGYFATRSTQTGLAESSAQLSLRLPVMPPPPKTNYSHDYSEAIFLLGRSAALHDPTAGEIGDGAAAWLEAANSPAVARVTLTEPTWGGQGDSRDVRVTLRPTATQADALALQEADPALGTASWGISLAADGLYRPHDYYAKPHPPSDADLQTWRDISALIGPGGELSGRTDVPREQGRQAETVVEFSLPSGAGSEAEARRVAFGAAGLLRRFGRPVAMTAYTDQGRIELIVGGCYRHDLDHRRLPLEAELSREFERC